MKKLILGLAMVLGAGTAASAQNIFDAGDDNHSYFGARLSLDMSCPTDVKYDNLHLKTDLLKSGAGFSAGIIYNVPVWMNLYVEPGFNLFYHTSGIEVDLLNADGTLDEDYTGASLREFGFNVPIVLGYHFDFDSVKVRAFTGPVFGVGLKGKVHYKADVNNIGMSGSDGAYGDDGGFNRGNVSWRFGAGVDYKNYTLSLFGDVEMTNAANMGENVTMHRHSVNIALGYNF